MALYRIFTALYILLVLMPSTEMYTFLGALPDDFYHPPPGPMVLLDGFPPTLIFYILHLFLILGLLGMLVGYKTIFSSILVGVALLVIKGFFYSIGKINHDLLIVMVPLIMAFSGWGSRYSIDAWQKPVESRKRNIHGWPIILQMLVVSVMMFTAGFTKLIGGWLDPQSQAVYGHLFRQYFVKGRQDLLASQFLMLDSRFFWESLDYLTIILEVGFIVAILHRTSTRIFVSLAVVFHFSVMLMLNIAFVVNLLAYAAVLDWSWIHQKLRSRFPLPYGPVLGLVGGFALLFLAITAAQYLQFPAVTSDLDIAHVYLMVTALPVALYYLIFRLWRGTISSKSSWK